MPTERPRALIAVAHPDDEVLFFGGLLHQLVASGFLVDVACATSDFGAPGQTTTRRAELRRSCLLLGASPVLLGLADRPGPLDRSALESTLRERSRRHAYERVYTHGVWGEYGHVHHTGVCRAVHRVFGDGVLSLAGPLEPVATVTLTADALAVKRRIAAEAHRSQRFASSWCSGEERFIQLLPEEVEAISALAGDATERSPPAPGGRVAAILQRSLDAFAASAPPFAEIANIPRSVWERVHADRHARLREILDGHRVSAPTSRST